MYACAAHSYTTLPFRFLGNVDSFDNAAKSLLQLNLKLNNNRNCVAKSIKRLHRITSFVAETMQLFITIFLRYEPNGFY